MNVDWDLTLKITIPLLTLILGKYLDRFLTKRPKLITYVGHISEFKVRGEVPMVVRTHGIVIRNAGRETANNVRVGHLYLPDNYRLNPSIPHTVEGTEGEIREIVIPKLRPGEQVEIAYLYFPPVVWNTINSVTKSDECIARVLNVLPTPQPPQLALYLARLFIFLGFATLMYFCVEGALWLFR